MTDALIIGLGTDCFELESLDGAERLQGSCIASVVFCRLYATRLASEVQAGLRAWGAQALAAGLRGAHGPSSSDQVCMAYFWLMVTATKGVLVSCDKQTRILIKHLHQQQLLMSSHDIIILHDLDDQHLLISSNFVELVKREIAKYQDANTYTRLAVDNQ